MTTGGGEPTEALIARLANELFGRLEHGPGAADPADASLDALAAEASGQRAVAPAGLEPGAAGLGAAPVGSPSGATVPAVGVAPPFLSGLAQLGFSPPALPAASALSFGAPDVSPAAAPSFGAASPPVAPPSFGVAPFAPGAGLPPETDHYLLGAVGPITPVLTPAPAPVGRVAVRDGFDSAAIREQFPILREQVRGRPLVWLDNAATTQKPQRVIDRLVHYYQHENSNIHRAAHTLAARSTDAFEHARGAVARFLNAGASDEIVFVRGATEGINLIAQAWGGRHLREGDEIVLSTLEHHSNIVPWQLVAQRTGARLRVIPVDDRGEIDLDAYQGVLGPRTRVVAVTHVSNALGTVVPVSILAEAAHRNGTCVVVDGAQAVSHFPVDVRTLGADFYVFSGHKVYGPTGIGAVWGRPEAWAQTPPWQGGGNMIEDVRFERTVYAPPPARFEAGTANIADAVGLGAALEWLLEIGMVNVARHEQELLAYGTARLAEVPGLRFVGTAREKAGVLSFVLAGRTPGEVGAALDAEGIAVRAGHHCAQPALRRFGLEAAVRPSLGIYNTHGEIDALVDVVRRLAR